MLYIFNETNNHEEMQYSTTVFDPSIRWTHVVKDQNTGEWVEVTKQADGTWKDKNGTLRNGRVWDYYDSKKVEPYTTTDLSVPNSVKKVASGYGRTGGDVGCHGGMIPITIRQYNTIVQTYNADPDSVALSTGQTKKLSFPQLRTTT